MANPALRRRQLARTCKKYGLLIQPNALPLLIEEMESRDGIDGTFGDFLTVLQTKLSRSSAPTKLVTLDLVERVLLEEQQEQQQQQAQLLAAKAKQDAKLKKKQQKILIQNEDDEDNEDVVKEEEEEEEKEKEETSNNYNSLVAVSSKSKLNKSKVSSLVPSVRSSSSSSNTSKKSKLWKVISAFDTPKLVYDSMRKQFRYDGSTSSASNLMGSSQDIMNMRIQRYELVKQKVDRYRQEQRLSYLTTIDRLLGTKNKNTNNTTSTSGKNELSLLGMLKSNPSLRCLELEDPTGCVPLRIDLLLNNNDDNNDDNDNDIIGCDVDTTGIYLEGSMVLVKGNHEESSLLTTNSEDNDGTVFRCTSIELAPIELKSITKLHLPPSPYSYDDDLNSGGRSQSNSKNKNVDPPIPIYSLSNLSLDDPDCIDRLEIVIDRMIQGNKKKKKSSSSMEIDDEDQDENENDNDNVPDSILILFGNFCTESTTSSQALDELAGVLQSKNIPSKHSILLIPGPNDVGSNACWPLPAWNKKNTPSSIHPFLASNSNSSNINTTRMRDNNNNAWSSKGGNVYLCSNPCRLECADGRQVVLLRKDLIRESLQHQVLADADSIAYSNAKAALGHGSSQSQSQSHPSSPSLTSRVIHHALSQGHLSPSSSSQQAASTSCAPIYWNYDHSMTLYPLPDLMIVGLDPEYLDTGFDNIDSEVGGRNVGCRVVSPASKPSQNEWECSLTTLRSNKKGNKLKLDVEFLKNNDDDDDDDDSDSDDDDVEEGEKGKQDQENQKDEDIYENYHMLGGTQTQQSQVSAY
jgi:hypothetical protein